MNKTKIEWCDSTWNPVTGCLHGCPYCYARRIAERFGTPYSGTDCHVVSGKVKTYEQAVHSGPYPYGFAPTLYKYRIDEPRNTKKPQRIFVCSMADLFGEWVPDEWIIEVFKACAAAPWHRYLFLTKNPSRYARLARAGILPDENNYWYGATFEHSNWEKRIAGHDAGDYYFPEIGNRHTFVSFEPLLQHFNIGSIGAEWVIVGAESGNRKGKVIPKLEWIEKIADKCRDEGTPVFMKNSLQNIWLGELIQEWPESLRKEGVPN